MGSSFNLQRAKHMPEAAKAVPHKITPFSEMCSHCLKSEGKHIFLHIITEFCVGWNIL